MKLNCSIEFNKLLDNDGQLQTKAMPSGETQKDYGRYRNFKEHTPKTIQLNQYCKNCYHYMHGY